MRKLQSKKLCFEISNHQKSFDITQLNIISHGKISQTLFTFEVFEFPSPIFPTP
jgi:hypothetical protein